MVFLCGCCVFISVQIRMDCDGFFFRSSCFCCGSLRTPYLKSNINYCSQSYLFANEDPHSCCPKMNRGRAKEWKKKYSKFYTWSRLALNIRRQFVARWNAVPKLQSKPKAKKKNKNNSLTPLVRWIYEKVNNLTFFKNIS